MSLILKIFITGLGILMVAILMNLLASSLGITTWYGLIDRISEAGLKKTIKENPASLIFLLAVYPFILGAAAYYILKILG